MVKKAALLILLLTGCSAFGQNEGLPITEPPQILPVNTDSLALDSLKVCTLPSFSEIVSIVLKVDSTVGGIDGTIDSIKIGISGELAAGITPYRFADLDTSGLTIGTLHILSHFQTRQNVSGGQYTHEDGVTIENDVENVAAQAMGLRNQPIQDFDTTLSMSSSTIKHYQGGKYNIYSTISFSTSGPNRDIHAHINLNETKLFNVAFQRKVGAANDVGDAGHLGNVILSAGDSITLVMESAVVPNTITINHSSFTLTKINDLLPYKTEATPRDIYVYTTATKGRFRVFVTYRRYL